MYYRSKLNTWLTIFGFSLIAFLIVFFSLNYEEIKKNSYIPISCYATSSDVIPRNCCHYYCPPLNYLTCLTSTTAESCASKMAKAELLHPDQCLDDPKQCIEQSSDCSGGYYCCYTKCDTCKSCKNPNDCKTYPCRCRCSLFTYHLGCNYKCDECYSVKITFKYDYDNKIYQASKSFDFKKDFDSADVLIKKYADNQTEHTCWVNPKSPNTFALSVKYTEWKWIILFLVCLISISSLWNTVRIGLYNYEEDIAAAKATSIILGFMIPFVILGPIYAYGDLGPNTNNKILSAISILFGVGNMWSILIFLNKHMRCSHYITGSLLFAVFTTFVLLLPIIICSNKNKDHAIVLIIVINCVTLLGISVYKYATRPLPAIEIPVAHHYITSASVIEEEEEEEAYKAL